MRYSAAKQQRRLDNHQKMKVKVDIPGAISCHDTPFPDKGRISRSSSPFTSCQNATTITVLFSTPEVSRASASTTLPEYDLWVCNTRQKCVSIQASIYEQHQVQGMCKEQDTWTRRCTPVA